MGNAFAAEKIAENMRYYEHSRKPPKEALKDFKLNNMNMTDINPQYRIKVLTEMFGPCGIGWWVDLVGFRREEPDPDTTMIFADIKLYIKNPENGEWSYPIFGTGGNILKRKTQRGIMTSDEAYKMAYTDAISVACKALGIGADIYWNSDKTKYSQYYTDAPAEQEIPKEKNVKPAPPLMNADAAATDDDEPPFEMSPDGEVTQDKLTKYMESIIKNMGRDDKLKTQQYLKTKLNGSANFRAVADPAVRKEIFDYFWNQSNAI